jgi:alcohol dehydrogenase class IV
MSLDVGPFAFDYQPSAIHFGRNCVANLGNALADRDCEGALVVCGRNVGANRAVMDPVEAGLGDRLAGVFAETTPKKTLETVFDARDRLQETGADAVVAVGAGSSLDIARYLRLVAHVDESQAALRDRVERDGMLPVPDEPLLPMVAVPTTFAGADLSAAAAVTYATEDGRSSTATVDNALLPTAAFYDPALFETTPMDVLAGSAMNGFDKALECLYAANATPVTDATAVRALQYLRSSFPALRTADDPAVMDRAVVGILLAQYGVSQPGAYKLSLVHAFGHGLRHAFGLQQCVAHAVVVPHALELLFEQVDARRDLLAEGLVTDDDVADPAAAVIEAVTEIRDGLDLPTRLRDLEGTDEDRLREVAEITREDAFMVNSPPDFDPSVDDLESVLRAAW